MAELNYHHLRYFRAVAHDGNLTRTAERLNVSQSALSTQIKQLEARMGHKLFERKGRRLTLTEAGRIALDHADRIFGAGDELMATLNRTGTARQPIRIGALSTLSRNFQLEFLRPIIGRDDLDIILRSGGATVLLEALQSLMLDVVLTTEPPGRDAFSGFTSHRISEQKVGVYGTARRMRHTSLESLLASEPVILPTESSIRTGFDSLTARLGVSVQIAAEVDDMAMVRLLAREDAGLAITPAVVLADEISNGLLQAAPFSLDIVESFYAVTVNRNFPNPIIKELIGR
jgi:LysR family transcriptional activator of nhaA